MKKDRINRRISFDGAYDTGNELYVSSGTFNGLLKVDKSTMTAQFLESFTGESKIVLGLHHKVYGVEDKLYFVPDNADEIHVYNLEEKWIQKCPIDIPESNQIRCIDSFLIDNKIWLFYAYADNPIVIFDVKTNDIEYLYDINDYLPNEIKERNLPVFWSVFSKCGNQIYGVIWDSPYVIRVNVENMEIEVYSVEKQANRLSGIACMGEKIYLTELYNQNIVLWNIFENTFQRFTAFGELQLNENMELVYSSIIAVDEQIILIPNSGSKILMLDEESNKIVEYASLPDGFKDLEDERKSWRRFYSYDFLGDRVRLYPSKANMMLDIICSKRIIEGYEFDLDQEWVENKYYNVVVESYLKESVTESISEREGVGLKEFVEYLDKYKSMSENKYVCGERVWEYVKSIGL